GRWHVGAVSVVNALGDVRNGNGHIIAGARADEHRAPPWRFIDASRELASNGGTALPPRAGALTGTAAPMNTTLSIVATDAPLGRLALTQLARAAGAALFRRITPTGTSVDGDVVFAI